MFFWGGKGLLTVHASSHPCLTNRYCFLYLSLFNSSGASVVRKSRALRWALSPSASLPSVRASRSCTTRSATSSTWLGSSCMTTNARRPPRTTTTKRTALPQTPTQLAGGGGRRRRRPSGKEVRGGRHGEKSCGLRQVQGGDRSAGSRPSGSVVKHECI